MPEDRAPAPGAKTGSHAPRRRGALRRLWYVLLVIQFVAVLVPTFYTREMPKLGGIPFFYWYQFAWIIGSVLLTGIVYFATRDE